MDPKTGKSLTSKPRLQDFSLKVGAIPKDGLWTMSTGSWANKDAVGLVLSERAAPEPAARRRC